MLSGLVYRVVLVKPNYFLCWYETITFAISFPLARECCDPKKYTCATKQICYITSKWNGIVLANISLYNANWNITYKSCLKIRI